MSDFKQYRRTQIAEMTPWVEGFDMRYVSVSVADTANGSPKPGDMIARNPKCHTDQWLVAAQYFADNFATLSAPQADAAYTMDQIVSLTYTNYCGETAQRHIVPKSLRFGSTEWHPEPQWLLLAWDADKRADREFALKDFGSVASQATEPDGEPFGWIAPDGKFSLPAEMTKEKFLAHFHEAEIGTPVIALYTAPPSQSAEMRRALVLAEDVLSRAPFSTGIWPNGMHPQRGIEIIRKALSRADEGKESEGGPLNWQLSDEAKARIAEIDANRRNAAINASNIVAGSPSDPTSPDRREAIARIIKSCCCVRVQGEYHAPTDGIHEATDRILALRGGA